MTTIYIYITIVRFRLVSTSNGCNSSRKKKNSSIILYYKTQISNDPTVFVFLSSSSEWQVACDYRKLHHFSVEVLA